MSEPDDDFDPYSLQPEPEIYWCLHCNRTYRKGEWRTDWSEGFELRVCHYKGCDGSVEIDGWDWEEVREKNVGYPKEPQPGKVYPLYTDS